MKTMRAKGLFSILNQHKCVSQVLPIHLNTYVMGPLLLYFYSYSALSDFRRQNLTSTDVRF